MAKAFKLWKIETKCSPYKSYFIASDLHDLSVETDIVDGDKVICLGSALISDEVENLIKEKRKGEK